MLNLQQEDGSFLAFSDLLTGYRLSLVLMQAHEAGVFDAIGREGAEGPELCARLGWEPVYGARFLRCLCGLGLLGTRAGRYFLSSFAATYLCSGSARYQGRTLDFEKKLFGSWERLTSCLAAGKRVFSTADKDPQELQRAFSTYLGSMDEAARIRSRELWEWFPPPAAVGTILDMGAGSGAFLGGFLTRYPGWRGIFCDLPEVVADPALHGRLAETCSRLSWCGCNLLADAASDFDLIREQSCDLVVLSNIIHCQGRREAEVLLRKAVSKACRQGVLVIHDFFSDTGWRGALYDIHMMLNTFNGKTYPLQEIVGIGAACGFGHTSSMQLPSGSTVLVLAEKRESIVPFTGL